MLSVGIEKRKRAARRGAPGVADEQAGVEDDADLR